MRELFLLLGCHAFGDYVFQSDWVGRYKNRHNAKDLEPYGLKDAWMYVLPSHGLTHGVLVFLVTGNIWLGIAETIIHTVTDALKCEKKISFHQDQAIHIISKFIWWIL